MRPLTVFFRRQSLFSAGESSDDVGYPALPMDVALAKAWITSLEYTRVHLSSTIRQWNTKFY
jgi:iron complex outermembrane receptor protein